MKWIDWVMFRADNFVYKLPLRMKRWLRRRAAARRGEQHH